MDAEELATTSEACQEFLTIITREGIRLDLTPELVLNMFGYWGRVYGLAVKKLGGEDPELMVIDAFMEGLGFARGTPEDKDATCD